MPSNITLASVRLSDLLQALSEFDSLLKARGVEAEPGRPIEITRIKPDGSYLIEQVADKLR